MNAMSCISYLNLEQLPLQLKRGDDLVCIPTSYAVFAYKTHIPLRMRHLFLASSSKSSSLILFCNVNKEDTRRHERSS